MVRRFFESICEVITPDGKDDLFARAINQVQLVVCFVQRIFQTRENRDSQLADRVFHSIDQRFSDASSRQEKIEVLSLITDLGLTLNEVLFFIVVWDNSLSQTIQCIPSASLYYLNLAKTFNKGGLEFGTHCQRERFDEHKIGRFTEFVTRYQ